MSLESALASLEAAVTTLTAALREGKPTAVPAAESSVAVPAPAESAPNTTPPPSGSAQPVAPAAAAVTPAKEPTLDDVRTALVQCQTRKGGRAPAQEILEKYSTNKVTGGVPKDKYAALIAECNAA